MPRISMYKSNKSSDYKFQDRALSERFAQGGTGILCHKYVGVADTGPSTDATQPQYTNQSEQNIQDLLFMENRDRKYDPDVYVMRGVYTRSDQDFDLSQFGLFLTAGTIFMHFHLNDMVDILGRKIMPGDVLELEHLKDEHALDDSLPIALKRFYVCGDASWPADGFGTTWMPHTWRVKLTPLVDSQEYKDIIKQINDGLGIPSTQNILSTYDKYVAINEAVVQQANNDVPKSGFNIEQFFTKANLADSVNGISTVVAIDTGVGNPAVDTAVYSPTKDAYDGYLTGDGKAPNGLPVLTGNTFPDSMYATVGDYFLRLDFLPPRLFRYNGTRWAKIEDVVRTTLDKGLDNTTQLSGFVNNDNTFVDKNQEVVSERQSLSKAFRAKPD